MRTLYEKIHEIRKDRRMLRLSTRLASPETAKSNGQEKKKQKDDDT